MIKKIWQFSNNLSIWEIWKFTHLLKNSKILSKSYLSFLHAYKYLLQQFWMQHLPFLHPHGLDWSKMCWKTGMYYAILHVWPIKIAIFLMTFMELPTTSDQLLAKTNTLTSLQSKLIWMQILTGPIYTKNKTLSWKHLK